MRKQIRDLAFGIFSLGFIIIIFGSYVIVAQTLTGTWTARTEHKTKDGTEAVNREKIYLTFSRAASKNGHNIQSSDFAYADLQGLTFEKAQSGGKVNFRLAREAGTIDCEGVFTSGSGNGTFTFTADQGFVDGMKARGFTFRDDQLFAAVTINVTMAAADDLKNAGFGQVGVDDLFKVVIFKITPQYMAEMKATGFPNLGLEDLVKGRIFKIDADFVRQVQDMGFNKDDFEGLVKFRIFKVTPEFLTELRNEGFSNLTAEDVVKFRIFKIDSEFIRQAKAEDPNVTVQDLVQMKIGVRRK